MRLERYKQIKQIWLTRNDLKVQLSEINESIIEEMGDDIIKEYLTKKMVDWRLRMDQIDDIKFKMLKLEWLEYQRDVSIYNLLYNILLNNVLLPDYSTSWNKDDIFDEFDSILERVNTRTSRILENMNNRWFFNINIWNKEEIENELEWFNNNWWYLQYRNFSLNWAFGFVHIWENSECDWKYTFRIPIRIPWGIKQKWWEKSTLDNNVDADLIENILSKYFNWKNWNRTISKTSKDFKWLDDYYISVKRSLNKELAYWTDESSTYFVIDILNKKLKNISEPIYDISDVIQFLEWFFKIANVLINDIANKSWIHHKKKYLNFSTMYVYNEEKSNWKDLSINQSTLDKFSKLLVEMKKEILLDDIWWQEEAKEEISKIIKSIQHEEIMRSWWAKTTTWIIFEWPPWTWKTLLAQAIATEVKAQVYNIKLTDIASSAYINEWSNNLKELFKFLRYQASKTNKKIIVILDELDALFKKRDSEKNSWEDTKIVNTFLTEMSWFDDIDNIIFIWTTNHVDELDNAVIRSWRMSTKVKVWMPDFNSRKQIFNIHIKKSKSKSKKAEEAFNWLDIDELSTFSDWLSWADIEEVIRQVIEKKALEEVDKWEFSKIKQEDVMFFVKKIKKESKSNKLPTIGFIQ